MLFPDSPSSTASKDGTSNELITTTMGADHSQVRYPSVSRSAALFARNSRSETASESQPCESGAVFFMITFSHERFFGSTDCVFSEGGTLVQPSFLSRQIEVEMGRNRLHP